MGAESRRQELASLVQEVCEQVQLIRPDPEQLRSGCRRLRLVLDRSAVSARRKALVELAAALQDAGCERGAPVLDLLGALLPDLPDPWAPLIPLLEAEDRSLAAAALRLLEGFVRSGRLPLDRRLLRALAQGAACLPPRPGDAQAGSAPDGTDSAGFLEFAATVLGQGGRGRPSPEGLLRKDPDPLVRRLAAMILDRGGGPAPPAHAAALLGPAAFAALKPYLEYTRATYGDLLALIGGQRLDPRVVPSLQEAEGRWGKALVRQLVALLGWERLNRGLYVVHRVEVSLPGQMPVMARPREVDLLLRAKGARRGPERLVAIAHGAAAAPAGRTLRASDPVDRFRRLNTTHADLLAEILDVAPLDPAKVGRILEAMDRIVADYETLFREASNECRILPEIYAGLRRRVVEGLHGWTAGRPLSAEVTRLVQMFEDPANLGEVRTLHGLKRYLHQQGLKLGFSLVDQNQAPNRTVDVVLIDRRGRLQRVPAIRFAEFEPAAEPGPAAAIPYPVRLVVDGWVRQLLYGRTAFPDVNVFIFGNEVHYYIFFRNHPVFLRIDFSPPQRGGMIDLEYYGVSGYELDSHPNPTLDAIRLFFRDLDCDVSLQGTRLHVRYDKERCPDLADLCLKAQALLGLAPYLMDLDWQIGSLALGPEARLLVAEAWSRRYRESGVLPQRGLLTADRRGILCGYEPGPTGPVERRWHGKEPYADIFATGATPGFADVLRRESASLGMAPAGPGPEHGGRDAGLLHLERELLGPLRQAERTGRIARRGERLQPADPQLVQPLHEAERFAELLAEGGPPALKAIALARPLADLERFVEFETTGSVGALAVQRAALPVRGGRILVFCLRDSHGLVRMGLFAEEGPLLRRRARPRARWRSEGEVDPSRLWALLRGANYIAGAGTPPVGEEGRVLGELQELAAAAGDGRARRPDDQEKILGGLKAAPGRAVGRAIFGTQGRRPEDVQGAVLVAREVRPEDNPFLFRAAGVVSTGGAVLSHAALLAIQFGKPALLADARWSQVRGRAAALHFTTTLYRQRRTRLHGLDLLLMEVAGRRADELREGDLVVLDADANSVRILGQDRDTLSLYDGLRQLGEAADRAALATADAEIVVARAMHLRARHLVEKILGRLENHVLAAFAVEEVVAGEGLGRVAPQARANLLRHLLANSRVGRTAGDRLQEVVARLAVRAREAVLEAREGLAAATLLAEVVGLRLRACRATAACRECRSLLESCGLEPGDHSLPAAGEWASATAELDDLVLRRLQGLQADLDRELAGLPARGVLPATVRHLLRHRQRCQQAAGQVSAEPAPMARLRRRLGRADAVALGRRRYSLVLGERDCGFAQQPLIGWKAANLGEMEQLAGPGLCPPWFVVTDQALKLMLAGPGTEGGATLRDTIAGVLAQPGLEPARASALIRSFWEAAPVPGPLGAQVRQAYAALESEGQEARVAIRSSSCDEDSEWAMRAGEFETYLNVRGEASLLRHLRLTWAGLWSEQALHTRAMDPAAHACPRGGLIVQRMADARVSGVAQTVNIAKGDLGELVINAGLGLGEGIVSGLAAADLVTVLKDRRGGDHPLRFNYVTNDKPLQVIRDERKGAGTRLAETLYHQRLRPALEYVELCELVAKALALEAAYGYPLDLEFAIEGQRLWLLQARPIATFLGELQEMLALYPLAARPGADSSPQPGART